MFPDDQHRNERGTLLWILLVVGLVCGASCRQPPSGLFTEAPGSPFPVGSAPNVLAVGDFNGDGKPDLAVPNADDHNLTVLLGNGRGAFSASPGSPFPAGSTPISVAVGEFSGDHNLDLAVADESSNTLILLLGNGKGGFTEAKGGRFQIRAGKWWLGASAWPVSLAAGNFNGDDRLDLAMAVVGDNILTVLLGNGAGGFTEAPGGSFPVGTNPRAVAVGDFNGDGTQDVATANAESDNVTVLLGNGRGGFIQASGSPFSVEHYPRSVAVGDLNGDGRPDLAVVNAKSENVTVLLGNGTGRFTEAAGSPFSLGLWMNVLGHGVWPFCVAVGDFNEDGTPDLAVSNTNKIVTVLLGDGTGSFAEAPDSPFRVGSLSKWVVVSDFNGDGKPDLATANRDDGNVTVLLNNHSGPEKRTGALSAFCDTKSLGEVRQFFGTHKGTHKVPDAERTLQQAMERIGSCAALSQAQESKLGAWLKTR